MNPVTLTAGPLTATFVPDVGMICSSLTHEGEELLGQRKGLEKYAETGSTMGIPLLYPWANRLGGPEYEIGGRRARIDPDSPIVRTDANGLPIHGLVNASPHWTVLGVEPDNLVASLDFDAHAELIEQFPFPHSIAINATLTPDSLTIETAVGAYDDGSAVPLAFGWHPYLVLPGVPRADWHVEIPLTQRLVLDDRMIPTGEIEEVAPFSGPLGEHTFDDGYAGASPGTTFALSGGGRRIELELVRGYGYAQVYAPASEDAVCFEPMTAPTDALRSGLGLELVEPDDTYNAFFAIRVTR
ncbi:MAG TPA: aldose 1-epimerase [Thermoleophilaceae bacterium]